MANGKLEAIWIKRMRLGPMDTRNRALLRTGQGLVGNADRRLTTLIREISPIDA